jgi:predicted NBD/HSP70 family sugar kinase
MPDSSPPVGAGDLLQILLDGSARTKSELAAITGLSRGTVAARVDALSASNLVKSVGEAESSGGRRAAQLAFNPAAGQVLAIDLGATHATIAVTDLAAHVLEVTSTRISIADGPSAILGAAFDVGRALLAGLPSARLLGVGIGVPGPVEHSTGQPFTPPIMPGWDRFNIREHVRSEFGVEAFVDNDVNVLALGEHTLRWRDVDDLLFVKVATGIGAGIISGGSLQRGAQGSAGDIGHVQVPCNRDSMRERGDEADLESMASGPAIAARLRELGTDAAGSADVVRLVRAGNPEAIDATRQAGRDVGEVVATIVNLLNPSVVVLGGSIARAGEHLLAGVREVVYRRSIPLATRELRIVSSRAGESAGVLGAAMLVIQHVLTPASIEARVAS